MTDKKSDLSDEQIELLVSRALRDDMIPTTLDEVAAAEMETHDDAELPPLRLQESGPSENEPQRDSGAMSPEKVTSLEEARRRRTTSPLQLGVSALLGAAAAALLMFYLGPVERGPGVTAAGGEIARGTGATSNADQSPSAELHVPCESCCGGTQCQAEPVECASGRTCVSCSPGPRDEYRLRLGHLAWAAPLLAPDEGSGQLVRSEPNPLICIVAGREEEVCLGEDGDEPRPWYPTPVSFTASQMQNQLIISLRRRRDRALLGVWKRQLALSSGMMCRGVVVELADGENKPVASLSLFVDDAQFVEIARASTVQKLLTLRERLQGERNQAKVYELSSGEFALSVGPLSGGQAEKVRWQLLQGGLEAKLTTADDYAWGAMPE